MVIASPHPDGPGRSHCCRGWQSVCHLLWTAGALLEVGWGIAVLQLCTSPSLLLYSCLTPLYGTFGKKMATASDQTRRVFEKTKIRTHDIAHTLCC